MSVENARLAYPLLVRIASELVQAIKDRKPASWYSYDDFCNRCKEAGLKETPRTVATKLLKPIQALCIEHEKPDLSALIISKPKARSDFGNLLRPTDAWWEPLCRTRPVDTRRHRFLVPPLQGSPRPRMGRSAVFLSRTDADFNGPPRRSNR